MEVFTLIWKLEEKNHEIIFIDEFKYSAHSEKQYGWVKRDSNSIFYAPPDSFSFSFWIGFSNRKIYGIMGTKSTFDWDLFIEFIAWISNYIPSKSIFIADNASLHKTQKVVRYFEDNNLLLQTIPAYSPWMNPVEKLISSIKAKMRKYQQIGKLISLPLVKKVVKEINKSNLQTYFDMSKFETSMFIHS